jgi:hypothetical protein
LLASSASSAQDEADKEITDNAQNAVDADDAGETHRQADADDADGIFRGNGITDTKQKTFADDADDAVVCPTFTNDDANITPAGWTTPF